MKKLVLLSFAAVLSLGAVASAHAAGNDGSNTMWGGITSTPPKTDPVADEEAPRTAKTLAHAAKPAATSDDGSADEAASVAPSTGTAKVQKQDSKAYND